MSDHTPSTPAPDRDANAPKKRGRLRRFGLIAVIVVLAGFAGAMANQAVSGGYGFGPGAGMWHGRGFMGGRLDPAFIEQRADRMTRHLAVEIDATADQQEKLRALVRSTLRDLMPLREKTFDGRERVRALLTQPTIDRAAIEAFRAEKVALAEQFSTRVAKALGDAAEILTPEQRRLIADHMADRSSYGRGRRRDRMLP
jgi:periplasmic protein CpxP/Spy